MQSPSTSVGRPRRLRSRTATVSFGQPSSTAPSSSPPLMSRDPSTGMMSVVALAPSTDGYDPVAPMRFDAGRLDPSRIVVGNRRSSKSVSGARPPLSTSAASHRTFESPGPSNASLQPVAAGPSTPIGAPGAPTRRNGLKRRISTPNLNKRALLPEEEADAAPEAFSPDASAAPASLSAATASKVFETRARSTSTSIVVPQSLDESPTEPVQTLTAPPLVPLRLPLPQSWSDLDKDTPIPQTDSPSSTILESAYDLGDAVVSHLISWTKPRSHRPQRDRRSSDEDSEKGLDGSEEDEAFDDDDGQMRVGMGRRGSRYWGFFSPPEGSVTSPESPNSYFALPTRPDERRRSSLAYPLSLPTPALSTQSLSHSTSRTRRRAASRAAALAEQEPADGWWVKVYRTVTAGGSGKTAEVLRELGWTVSILAGLFVLSFLLVLYTLQSLPITQLKSLPKSTTDLQLLSAEMRAYMAGSSSGWWHTVLVLTYVGCWKHAWSVPGAVVLNILIGSVFEPVAALGLLTLITASGSLCAYMLSRPLAPLIAVLFPKPLALVRAALAPESVPQNGNVQMVQLGESITPVQVSQDPAEPPLGAPEDRPNVWRRLLLMRAMGFVPWSGMNVACGVVGVDWRTFWLTTAAGSASWSYVTASVGNILSRLALPSNAASLEDGHGESLTSLLRDPSLIAKLVFLTLLTIVPVLLKKRTATADSDDEDDETEEPTTPDTPSALGLDTSSLGHGREVYPSEPPSPLAASLASFTPTPHVFDLLSFGRQVMRQGVRVVVGTARTATTGARRLVTSVVS
ncbi:hypothetical protein Q8F55_000296 [Vanrija albida]|uniref:Golgi apparatus membrane protein tvp38 n=1 Tax=Vanrija albida TaxID=181172 RepID=A0ABR3QD29_9TREE